MKLKIITITKTYSKSDDIEQNTALYKGNKQKRKWTKITEKSQNITYQYMQMAKLSKKPFT